MNKMRRGHCWYLIATLGLVANVGPAGAVVLCAKKSGAMVARTECKRKEMQIKPGGGALHVVDSKGAIVGAVMAYNSGGDRGPYLGLAVRVLEDGTPVVFRVGTDRLDGSGSELDYEDSACTGVPYIDNPDDLFHTTYIPYSDTA